MKMNWLFATGMLTFMMVFALGCPESEPEAKPSDQPVAESEGELVIYSGRSKALVDRVVQAFEKETGTKVTVRYGSTTPLAMSIQEQGEQSDADVFWGQDAGAMGALSKAGLLAPLPESLTIDIPEHFRTDSGEWVATSGRARVLAWSPDRVSADALPDSVTDLTDEAYQNRVAWAPTNASFHSFVTAMRVVEGDEKTLEWLIAMKNNGARAYPNNTGIIQAIAAGEVDYGITNHYYLLRFKVTDSKYPVEQRFFKPDDIGNLVNVAGIGRLKSAQHPVAADAFIKFLLSPRTQQFFTSSTFEYPISDEVIHNEQLVSPEALREAAPKIDLDKLDDLEGTMRLLREAGLL